MFRLSRSAELAAAPTTVSSFLADPENEAKWQPGVVHVQRLSGATGKAGARYERVQVVGGKNIKTEVELVEHAPGARVAFAGKGKVIELKVAYALKAAGAKTQVTMSVEGEMLGFAAMFESIASDAIEKGLPESLKNLASALSS